MHRPFSALTATHRPRLARDRPRTPPYRPHLLLVQSMNRGRRIRSLRPVATAGTRPSLLARTAAPAERPAVVPWASMHISLFARQTPPDSLPVARSARDRKS